MSTRLLCVLAIQLVYAKDDEIVVEVAPETIIEGFRTMMTSQYIRTLADDFATKAAQHLIEELKKKNGRSENPRDQTRLKSEDQNPKAIFNKPGARNQKHLEVSLLSPVIPYKAGYVDLSNRHDKTEGDKKSKEISPQLLKLLKDPAPDGDYPDREAELTDYETNKKSPEATEHRINGKHFRRISIDFIFI